MVKHDDDILISIKLQFGELGFEKSASCGSVERCTTLPTRATMMSPTSKPSRCFFFVKSSEAIIQHICKVKRMYNALQINGKCSGGGKVTESNGKAEVSDQDE